MTHDLRLCSSRMSRTGALTILRRLRHSSTARHDAKQALNSQAILLLIIRTTGICSFLEETP
jgi:hypothetical protein